MTSIDLSEYDVPGRGRGLADVVRWRYLLRLLIRKGTATRYRNSVLGWTWSYVKPLVQFFIYFAVMGVIFGMDRGTDNYPLYLFSGFITVQFFNEAFGNATSSVVGNKALVKKIYLPRELFPIAATAGAFVHFLPQLAILLVVAFVYGWVPGILNLGAILLGLLIIALIAFGLGLLFAGINVRFRDIENFGEVIRQLATWASPVLYTWQLIEEHLGDVMLYVYMCNPITVAVELMHYGFWKPTVEEHAGGWGRFRPGLRPARRHRHHHQHRHRRDRTGHVPPLREHLRPGSMMSNTLQQTSDRTPAIIVDGVTKRFMKRNTHSLKEGFVSWTKKKKVRADHFEALQDVSFQVGEGEAVAVLGFNGSGKSTTLKMVSGVMAPDEGRVFTKGRVAGLIEVGAGRPRPVRARERLPERRDPRHAEARDRRALRRHRRVERDRRLH